MNYKRTTLQFYIPTLPAIDLKSNPEDTVDQLLVEMTNYMQTALKTEDMDSTANLAFQQLVNRTTLFA